MEDKGWSERAWSEEEERAREDVERDRRRERGMGDGEESSSVVEEEPLRGRGRFEKKLCSTGKGGDQRAEVKEEIRDDRTHRV